MTKRAVILDTDIGDDIDDVWALIALLKSPLIDLKLITVAYGSIQYKAAFLAKILTELGRADIPIALGEDKGPANSPHIRWLNGFTLKDYPGKVFPNAAEAFKNVAAGIEGAPDVIAIGPLTNIAAFTKTGVAFKVYAMGGAYRLGYYNQTAPAAEFNILMDTAAADIVFKGCVDFTLFPLDVCRELIIDGGLYGDLRESGDKFLRKLMQIYDDWQLNYVGGALKKDAAVSSSILYDLAPVAYLLDKTLFVLESVRMAATPAGETVGDVNGGLIKVAAEVDKERMLRVLCGNFLR